MLRSVDGGKTWQITGDFGDLVATCFVGRGNVVFAGTNGGVFVSTDDAASWTRMSDGIDFDEINTLALQGSTLCAGTMGGGVYSAVIGTMSAGEAACAPLDFSVFTDAGRLKLQLSKPLVQNTMSVFFDILGNEIFTANIPAGTVSVRIDAMPSGIYYCAITSGGEHAVRPIIIMR